MHTCAGNGSQVLVAIAHVSPYAHSPPMVVTQPPSFATFALHVDGVVVVSQ
jgi:hypothetical protein